MTPTSFNPIVCDLCGSMEQTTLVSLNTPRSMRSDRAISEQNLVKVACSRCGLVRSGETVEGAALSDYYTDHYTLSTQPVEHYFYTPQGSISRSAMIADWLVQSMGAHRWQSGYRCLEVGAGSGALMSEFVQRFPEIQFEGIELNKGAAELAQQRGLAVRQGNFDVLGSQQYDIIYSIAVIEHVPSPTEFLRQIREHLRPGGWLFLCQPTQDVPTYDVFFVDHLHHFGTEHLHEYARKCGFREQGLCVGQAWMPNFSLHLLQATEAPSDFQWYGVPGYTSCAETVSTTLADIARLNQTLHDLRQSQVAVFGLNEVYWLARAYTALGDFPVICGLDDMPDKPEYLRLGFPVVRPEESVSYGVRDVILTMNKVYYAQAAQRMQALGLTVYPFLN
jgi:SAM-dependent methyltransferase